MRAVPASHTVNNPEGDPTRRRQATVWCRERAAVGNLGEMLAWMPAMQLQAAGHLEAALESYAALLGRVEGGMSGMREETTAFAVAQASKAYAAVADWEGLEAFFARVEVNTVVPFVGS
jgi:hypothetical protein